MAAATVLPAQAATLYSNDFDAAPTVGLGATAAWDAAGGALDSSVFPYASTFGMYFRNNTTGLTELTLSSLPVHTSVDLGFALAFLESWDSRDGGCCTPDNLDLYIDGVLKASYTYNNALGTIKDVGGGTVLYEYVQFNANTFYSDTIADMSSDPGLSFAHFGSTLKIGFQASGGGWQGDIYPVDEAWGVDNLTVDVANVVPEPSTYALMLAGLTGVAAIGRCRRQASGVPRPRSLESSV